MANYNYKVGHKKVLELLRSDHHIEEDDDMPKETDNRCLNGHYCWTSAVFVNIRDSSKLFQAKDEMKLAKIIRTFTSEVIEILRDNESDNLIKEIGIRDDCVYAVYSTPSKWDIEEVLDRVFYVNTYIKMLNKLLPQNKINHKLKVGIGMASSKELAVNAERKGSKESNVVWVGKSISKASALSNVGARDDIYPIVICNKTYSNVSEEKRDLFKINMDREGKFHTSNAIFDEFKEWIDTEMPKK